MAFSGNQITGLKAWGVMGVVQPFEAKQATTIVVGPYCVDAKEIYTPGTTRATRDVMTPGAVAKEIYTPGAVEDESCG